jgi:hypothetical protein
MVGNRGEKMPISKRRKPKDEKVSQTSSNLQPVNFDSARWVAPAMVTFFILGLIYIVAFYIAGNSIPFMNSLNALWNIGIGFGFLVIGFILSTKWH